MEFARRGRLEAPGSAATHRDTIQYNPVQHGARSTEQHGATCKTAGTSRALVWSGSVMISTIDRL